MSEEQEPRSAENAPGSSASTRGKPLRVLADRAGRAFTRGEEISKGLLFDCRMCGQCMLQQTALICPMRCPKGMRNGPCGGSSPRGMCEVYPDQPCIWVDIYERAHRFGLRKRVEKLQWPLDWSLQGTSAYGNVLNGKWFTPRWTQILQRPDPPLAAGTRLEHALASGRFVVTAELGPPRSANAGIMRKKAGYLREKVVAVNVTDNSRGMVHLSSLAGCLLLQEEGIEPILQMSCRDRNRIALQSDLLGASALGLGNVLLLTGDHQRFGDEPEAMGVFDLDSSNLLALARRMRDHGELLSGEPLPTPPRLLLGAAANPEGEPVDLQVLRLEKKVAAGADFIQTQAVFDLAHFQTWMSEVRARGLHQATRILVGVLLLHSAERADFLRRHVPGMRISDTLVERLATASSPQEEGKQIGRELLQSLSEIAGVAGVHLMTIAWEEAIPEVLAAAGL
jgi:methylenetetrahydrofolate reductase (NADPH)